MENIKIKNIGSYMVIKRIENSFNFGNDVYYGLVKYASPKSKVEMIYKSTVTYLKKDVEGEIIISDCKYDIVLYYNILLNFTFKDDDIS